MKVPFAKMQSLGNDFVVVDAVTRDLRLDAGSIRRIADRRLGIGCDQLLVAEKPNDSAFDFFFRVYNTDGSESGQCGNGIRCFHRFLLDQGLSNAETLRHQTITTAMTTHYREDGTVAVQMGEPSFAPATIPFAADVETPSYRLDVGTDALEIGAVSMGNPHAVLFQSSVDDAMVSSLGPKIEHHERFAKRTNVGFATVVDRETLNLRVHERGVGETLACGSGACAAVAVGIRQNRLDESVCVHLPGGQLSVQWEGIGHGLTLVGSADHVYDGEIAI